MKPLPKPRAGFEALALVCLAAPLLSSCVSMTPEQASANSVTRHEQRDEGIEDPWNDPMRDR